MTFGGQYLMDSAMGGHRSQRFVWAIHIFHGGVYSLCIQIYIYIYVYIYIHIYIYSSIASAHANTLGFYRYSMHETPEHFGTATLVI